MSTVGILFASAAWVRAGREEERPVARLRSQDGFALLEVLMAGGILSIAFVGLALLFSLGQSSVRVEGDERVALYLVQQRMEQLRTLGYDNIPEGSTSEPAGTIPGFPRFGRQTVVAVVPDPDNSGLAQAAKTVTITVEQSARLRPVTLTTTMFRH